MKLILLRLMIYFIAFVCAFDIYCTIKYSNSLYELELNPIAKVLITREVDISYKHYGPEGFEIFYSIEDVHIDVSKLVLFKVLGLIACLEIFDSLLASKHDKIAWWSISIVFIGQCVLLGFLLT